MIRSASEQILDYDEGRYGPELEPDWEPTIAAHLLRNEAPESDALQPKSSQMAERLLTIDQLGATPPLEWLIEDWLPKPALVLFYGPPKTKKSFVGTDISLSVAAGVASTLGPVNQQSGRNVLYVVGEGVSGIHRRVKAWEHSRAVKSPGSIVFHPGPIQLGDERAVNELAGVMADLAIDLLVIDTLARCTLGLEENSAKDMGQVVAALDHLKNSSGATVLVIHHAGKDGAKGARGSTALLGAVDVELQVSSSGASVRVACTAMKDAEAPKPRDLVLKPYAESAAIVHEGTSGQATPTQVMEVLEVLIDHDDGTGLASSTWHELSGLAKSSFFRAKKWLIDEGQVQNVGTVARPRFTTNGPKAVSEAA